MRIEGWLCLAVVGGTLSGLNSCTSKQVEASGYSEVALSGVASVRLPAQFAPLTNKVAAARPDFKVGFLGDFAGPAEDQNFWAITHAFAFREAKLPTGQVEIPALLVVSRVADKQSFSSAQMYFESAIRFSPDPRWTTPKRLPWKQRQIAKSVTLFEAELEEGQQASSVAVMVDRDSLLEAMLLGQRSVLKTETAQQVLNDLRSGYRVTQPLEDYFHQLNAAVQAQSDARRKNYLALLEVLQKEELDYTPTPRVVVFNPNLAGQFWWPMFDRGGVPTHFAIAARLGAYRAGSAADWRKLEGFFPGMRMVSAEAEGDGFRWKPLGSSEALPARTLALLADTRWATIESKQVFATLEFSFTQAIPNLSQWLNEIEAALRQAEMTGWVGEGKSR